MAPALHQPGKLHRSPARAVAHRRVQPRRPVRRLARAIRLRPGALPSLPAAAGRLLGGDGPLGAGHRAGAALALSALGDRLSSALPSSPAPPSPSSMSASSRNGGRAMQACVGAMSGLTGADLEAAIMNAPVTRCDDVAFQVFGISMAGYNGLVGAGAGGLHLLGFRPHQNEALSEGAGRHESRHVDPDDQNDAELARLRWHRHPTRRPGAACRRPHAGADGRPHHPRRSCRRIWRQAHL